MKVSALLLLVLHAIPGNASEAHGNLRKREERKLGGVTAPTLGAPATSTGATFGGGAITSAVDSPISVRTAVQYEVTFENLWTEDRHPEDFPGNAHWSAPVGGSHGCSYTMWNAGELASQGVINVAERGSTGALLAELNSEFDAGNVLNTFTGINQFDLDENPTQTVMVSVDMDHPLISLVTMIAPSPDWFAGIHDLEPVTNGRWWESFEIDLPPYDSGSDGGDTYGADNDPLDPREPISRIDASSNPSSMVFVNDGEVLPVARLSFVLVPP